MVAKLSGFAKFEVDMKLNSDQMVQLITTLSSPEGGALNEEKIEEIIKSGVAFSINGQRACITLHRQRVGGSNPSFIAGSQTKMQCFRCT